MSHTYISDRLHVVFSTCQRRDLIPSELRPRLWPYIVAIGRNHQVPIFAVGGIANHIHLLITLPANVQPAKAVQEVKANSSRWMRDTVRDFAWQEGYGAFSVSASNVAAVIRYIENQEEHHRTHTFEEEFRSLLVRHGIAFDEKYVFG